MGAEYVLCLMSGDYTQRGEPACLSRRTRVSMALAGGADAVLLYPARHATSSAEAYAMSAVRILEKLHVADALVFGSESGEIAPLYSCAEILADEPPSYREALLRGLKSGLSFPSARAAALPEYASVLSEPNQILGVEYCKALIRTNARMRPVTVKREGSLHGEQKMSGRVASASAIRAALEKAFRTPSWDLPPVFPPSLAEVIPPASFAYLRQDVSEWGILTAEDFADLLISALWRTDEADRLSAYADVTGSLAGTFLRERSSFGTWEDFAERCASKSLTVSHVSRAMLHMVLGMKKDPCLESENALFTQILGIRRGAEELLPVIRKASEIPVLVRPHEDSRILTGSCRRLFDEEVRVTNLYEALRARKSGTETAHYFREGMLKYPG